ncbi:uncharacterized protein LOC127841736 isoform X2 [Dreissena polymorpha]|uniref:uncharacterized protein LOC127841736 isoform X2 n=1 Tax=Dreissena polymorpha TaxID=45954 RepID=UPI002263E4FF|nr:uncharacterized protein LOC127841736 isoform X2 [Dreissena polymorpha]
MEAMTVECGICFADKVVGICENCECKLCDTCFRNHTRAKMFRTHIIFPIEDVNKKTIISNFKTEITTGTGLKSPVDSDIHKQTCKDHSDENQSLYCVKHDACICGRCVISNHASCLDSVVDLNNILHDAENMNKRLSTLQELDDEIDRTMVTIDENRRMNDTFRSSSAKEINKLHIELVDQLKLLITKAEKESDELHKQNADILDETELKCKEQKLVLRMQKELLDELQNKKHYRHLFVALKRNIKTIDFVKDNNARCRQETNIKEYEFVRNLKLVELFKDDQKIGTFTTACDGSDEVIEHIYQPGHPQHNQYSMHRPPLRPHGMPALGANSQPLYNYSNPCSQMRPRFSAPSNQMNIPQAQMYQQHVTLLNANAVPFQMTQQMPGPTNPGAIPTNQSSMYLAHVPYQAHNPAVYFSKPQKPNTPPTTQGLELTKGYDFVSSNSTTGLPVPQISEKLHELIVEKRINNEVVVEWIDLNVQESAIKSKTFIRGLMTAVCTSSIKGQKGKERLDPKDLSARSDLLQKYFGHQPESELQALYALQLLITQLKNPQGLLRSFFDILYDDDVISEDAFLQWEKSEEEQEGKGTALKQVLQFFKWLRDAEDDG